MTEEFKIYMAKIVTLREIRVLLQNEGEGEFVLGLKMCLNEKIFKYNNFHWNVFCKRWQRTQKICLQAISAENIEVQIFNWKASPLKRVLGEGRINLVNLPSSFYGEIKICLMLDGLVAGWLYCDLAFPQDINNINSCFLYIHKLTATFLDIREESCVVKIFVNSELIFSKQFSLKQKSKTLFPNIKKQVRKSDMIIFGVQTKKFQTKLIYFLIDHIKCGETAILDPWIRNSYKNKVGDLYVEYFLENIFLQNQKNKFLNIKPKRPIKSQYQQHSQNKQNQRNRLQQIIEQQKKEEYPLKDQQLYRVTRSRKKGGPQSLPVSKSKPSRGSFSLTDSFKQFLI